MPGPAVVIPDPERELVAILAAALGAGVASTNYPSVSLTGAARAVQVDLEAGDTKDYPVTERATVRVVCHRPSGKRTQVKADADQARRTLYTFAGSTAVAGITVGGLSSVSIDPDTGNVMCWFLARMALLAAPAS